MNIDAVKRLNAAEIKSLYTKSMKRDFPQNELRPYSTMKRLLRKNEYGVYRAYSNGEPVGYFSVFSTGGNVILLDYFAVEYGIRSRGIGSELFRAFAQIISKDYPNANAAVIECEAPYAAENPDEKKLRERRIGFYLKNGAVMTEHYWRAFGVEYNLLALPIEGADITPIDFGSEIHNLYLSSFGRLFTIHAKNKLKHWKK